MKTKPLATAYARHFAVCILLLLAAFKSYASIDPTAPVKGVIDHAKQAVNQVIADATASGNYTINHSANELSTLISFATQQFGNQMNKTVSQLKEENRKILAKIYDMTEALETGQATIVHLEDNLVLDMNSLLPGMLNGNKFIFKRLTGLTHLFKGDGNYVVSVTGSDFGLAQGQTKSEITSLSIDDKDVLGLVTSTASEQHTRQILIPATVLNAFFREDKVTPVKVVISMCRKTRKKFLLLFHRTKTETVSNTFYMYLFPASAGKYTFMAIKEKTGWVPCGNKSTTRTGGDNHCSKHCNGWYGTSYGIEFTVNGGHTPPMIDDQRLSNGALQQIDGPGGFDEDQHWDIVDNRTRIVGGWRGRTHPTTYRLSADVECYQVTGKDTESREVAMTYNSSVTVSFPQNTRLIMVSGTNIASGEKFAYEVSQPNKVFELVSQEPIGNEIVYIIRVRDPKTGPAGTLKDEGAFAPKSNTSPKKSRYIQTKLLE